jgi:hypothetical protein
MGNCWEEDMKIIQISVTQEDIRHNNSGGGRRCEVCPVARALSRAVGRSVIVGTHGWRFPHDEFMRRLPDVAIAAILRLDDDDATWPEPFSFTLDIPE